MQDMSVPSEIPLEQVWKIDTQLGRGGYGKVFKAQSEAGQPGAVKLIPKEPGAQRELLFEDLDGVTNVMPILDRGEFENSWVLVMPLAEKSLREYLDESGGQLTASDAVPILVDVVEALVAVEDQVVHRDIKPANILLLNGHWHLADFGIARYVDATTAPDTRKLAKSPPYAAPEQWREETATSATDVYAFGVVAYELLAGRAPFKGPDFRKQHLEESPGIIAGIPYRLRSLVLECLHKAAEARPRPQNLLTRLKTCLEASSPAGQLLQQANARAVDSQTEQDRELSAARVESERRGELLEAAEQVMEAILGLFDEEIMANAPTAQAQPGPNRRAWNLNDAGLLVEHTKKVESPSDAAMPFEVIGYATIRVTVPPNWERYGGRSHSLWYCDAQKKGVFRWYETAFSMLRGENSFAPFSLSPAERGTALALTSFHTYQVALPFTPIDQGEEGVFVESWLTWFGAAAKGELQRPHGMLVSSPQGSWRLGG